ncbi:hypothetical protein [Paraburkholderia youngii]|uniref:hypothetical protein n=1 Tax=Paraburkholderia youngii TaxID=2782701 RepID=UPI0015921379|nr:hypothetical protein [Paraburkholderia youngii]NUX58695.1 hypothetical protein [Paraburkholderia youngii]
MSNMIERLDEDMEIDAQETVFLVAFVEEGEGLVMTAVGELDNPLYRAIMADGLRRTADEIEALGGANGHAH